MYGSSYSVGKLGTNVFSPLLMESLRSFFIFFEIPGVYEIIGGIIVIGSVYLIYKNDKKTKVSK